MEYRYQPWSGPDPFFDESSDAPNVPVLPEEQEDDFFDQPLENFDPELCCNLRDDSWPDIVRLLSSSNEEEQVQGASLVGSYAETVPEGGGRQAQANGVLSPLCNMLYSYDPAVQIVACRALTAVAKDASVVDEVEAAGGLARLDYLRNSRRDDVSGWAATAVHAIHTCVKLCRFGPAAEADGGGWDVVLQVKQMQYRRCGVGFKIWPAAHILCRWMYDHRQIFERTRVLELGAGPGLASLLAAHFCRHVVVTDYLQAILEMISKNVAVNNLRNVEVRQLNWQHVVDKTAEPLEYDLIIGSDLIYGEALSELLAQAVAELLRKPGVEFFCVCQSNRLGIDEFPEHLARLGVRVESTPLEPAYYADFSPTNIWTFWRCTRVLELTNNA